MQLGSSYGDSLKRALWAREKLLERVEVIRAGIGMCQVIRQNQIFHKSFLAKGASLSFVLAEYWREQKEIGPKYMYTVQPELSF